jgi:GYF domain 2
MTWHYAAGGERHGPVDDAELDRLIAAGVVTGDTLVWHAGLEGWRPLRDARPAALLAAAARQPAAMAAAAPARPRPDADAEFARAAGRSLAPLSAIQRGMALVFAHPGPTIGVSALIMVLMIAAGFVPCVGSIVQIAVTGPLTAAWYGYFLRHIRGQAAAMEDVFAVFSSPDLLHMIAVHVIVTVISVILIVPFAAIIFFTMIGTAATAAAAADPEAPALVLLPFFSVFALGMLPVFAALIYLTMAFMFAPVLVLDRGHAFWPAMRLSQRVVNRRLLPMLGLVLLAWLIAMAGLLALCLGIFVAMPIVMASYAFAYEDLFGEANAA